MDQMTSLGYATNAETVRGNHWWHWGRNKVIQAALARQVGRKDLNILDYGAGGMMPLLSRFGHTTGVEPSARGRELAGKNGIALLAPEELSADATFDLITAFDVLEHVENELPWLVQLRDRLKAGGFLLLTVPAFSWLWNLNDVVAVHQRRYTKGELIRRLEEAGLEAVFSTYWNSVLLPGFALIALRDRFRLKKLKSVEGMKFTYLDIPPAPINALLKTALSVDSILIGNGFSLPFGVSILALARTRAR